MCITERFHNLHNRKGRHTHFAHVVAPTLDSQVIDVCSRDKMSIHKKLCPETVTLLVAYYTVRSKEEENTNIKDLHSQITLSPIVTPRPQCPCLPGWK